MNRPTQRPPTVAGRSILRVMGMMAFLAVLVPDTKAASTLNATDRASTSAGEEIVYLGCCDASATVAVNARFFLVASDEDSRLRMYDREKGSAPVQTFDLRPHLNLGLGSPETDIEGAARLGDRIYWITSHARNKDGKVRPNRHRFFATRFREENGRVEMTVEGAAYERLLANLVSSPELAPFNFAAASRLAPGEPGAFNIEGLAATADGHVLIGFRNPAPAGQALLIPMKNPAAVLAGTSPLFGEPIRLNLDGLGVRDITFHAGQYLIVAGPPHGGGREKLFAWEGPGTKPKAFKNVKLKDYNPEAIVVYPDRGFDSFQLFSDDSSARIGRTECGELTNPALKQFRSIWISRETD